MQESDCKYRLELGDFGEREEYEASARGYWSIATVVDWEGHRYPVFFYDPVRLSQDLQDEAASGRPFISEPGLIILTEVTRENMERAVQSLGRTNFFESLTPKLA